MVKGGALKQGRMVGGDVRSKMICILWKQIHRPKSGQIKFLSHEIYSLAEHEYRNIYPFPNQKSSVIFHAYFLLRFLNFLWIHSKKTYKLHYFYLPLYSEIDRGLLAKRYFVSWHPSGEHLVYGLFERHISILLPKKVPKQKTCQVLRKRVICDYLLLNCITAKKIELLNSTITKTTCITRKSTKNYIFKVFFILRIVRVIFVLNVKIEPKSRNKNWVLA